MMRKKDDDRTRRLAAGESAFMGNSKKRREGLRQIANLNQNDQIIELLSQLVAEQTATRLALERLATYQQA